MINILNLNKSKPYQNFKKIYDDAVSKNQQYIEAICISSFNKNTQQVDSRFVNLKNINDEKWIFFSNYNSKKAIDFEQHSQISAAIFWDKLNVQIRINAIVKKTTEEVSNKHFASRNAEKNALAISSNQSQSIDSYESVKKNYEKVLENKENFLRPDYWGGYEFTPHYFEFWQGHESRLNERIIYRKEKNEWSMNYLQP